MTDVANAGIVRPPLIYLCGILAGVALDLVWPSSLADSARAPLGIAVVLGAVVLFATSVREFRAAGTSVRSQRPTTAIVREGPYRFSRNPIYLAFLLLQLGIAIWIDSLWVLATLIPAAALVALVVVPREERYLEGRFGPEYAGYKAAVRRWI